MAIACELMCQPSASPDLSLHRTAFARGRRWVAARHFLNLTASTAIVDGASRAYEFWASSNGNFSKAIVHSQTFGNQIVEPREGVVQSFNLWGQNRSSATLGFLSL